MTPTTPQPMTAASLAEAFFEVDAKHENAMLDDTGRYHAYAEAALALLNASQTPQQMTAADLAHDVASDWFASLPHHTAYGVLTVEQRRGLKDTIAKELTTFAERARGEAIEECAKLAKGYPASTHGHLNASPHEAAAQAAQEIASAIRALSPTTEPTRQGNGT